MGTMPEGQPHPRTTTRVVVVHASDVIRAGLGSVLDRERDIEVIATAASAEEAIALLARTKPDVIVLDLVLAGLRGWPACDEIVRRAGSAAVVVLAASMEDTLIHTCLRAGARGFLSRSATAADVVAAVRAAARGEPALSPAVVGRLVAWAQHAAGELPVNDGSLSVHELKTISLVAHGLKTWEIAERLHVSGSSVKLYLRSAMRKLGVSERTSAVAACMRRGVI